jgi:hypothetical protein
MVADEISKYIKRARVQTIAMTTATNRSSD